MRARIFRLGPRVVKTESKLDSEGASAPCLRSSRSEDGSQGRSELWSKLAKFSGARLCSLSRAQPLDGRSSGGYRRHEGRRRAIAEAAVRTCVVVMLAPGAQLPPRVPQICKPTDIQTLITQAPIETFHPRILHRLTGRNVAQLNLPLCGPGEKVSTG